MPEPWVVNASPLIILSRISRLDFLESLAPTVLIPQAVIAEVGTGLNRDPTAATTLQWAKGRIVPNLPLPVTVAAWGLGAGESQVIAHCLGNARTAVLDDQAGRACARAQGVSVIGTLGVILLAQQRGLIGQARPWVMQAQAAGLFLEPALIAKVLAKYRRVISMQSKAIRMPSAGIPAAPDTTPASSAPARATARPARRGSAA